MSASAESAVQCEQWPRCRQCRKQPRADGSTAMEKMQDANVEISYMEGIASSGPMPGELPSQDSLFTAKESKSKYLPSLQVNEENAVPVGSFWGMCPNEASEDVVHEAGAAPAQELLADLWEHEQDDITDEEALQGAPSTSWGASATAAIFVPAAAAADGALVEDFCSTMKNRNIHQENREEMMAAIADDVEAPELKDFCTTMLKGIPRFCTKEEVLAAIAEVGFGGCFNHFYMPIRGKSENRTIAFVGFPETGTAKEFVAAMSGYEFSLGEHTKAITVIPAHIQGLKSNIAFFKKSRTSKTKYRPIFGNAVCQIAVYEQGQSTEDDLYLGNQIADQAREIRPKPKIRQKEHTVAKIEMETWCGLGADMMSNAIDVH